MMESDCLDYKQNQAMPSTYHSHIMELQLQKIFENIYSTNSLYHRNYKKNTKFHSVATQVSAEMAVVFS